MLWFEFLLVLVNEMDFGVGEFDFGDVVGVIGVVVGVEVGFVGFVCVK